MTASTTTSSRLSNLQMELLKLYSYNVSDKELRDIQKILADYFAHKVDQEMDQLWEKNDWNNEIVESWKTEHLRSKTSK